MAVQMCVLNEKEEHIGILSGYENGEVTFWNLDLSSNQFKLNWKSQEHQQPSKLKRKRQKKKKKEE